MARIFQDNNRTKNKCTSTNAGAKKNQRTQPHTPKNKYKKPLITSFAHFEAKVATRSADRRSQENGLYKVVLLLRGLLYCSSNVLDCFVN